ncbi:hypothetical protein [Mesorhizobium sp. M8A.F.Ca.ET.057.01.1.1]|uniref:hypothetical protein n=1 Tax=Mesorhizobium sp. M8A.F.Ca.ET.057.01.1.1 TaxID=2493679 RepID=UPI001FDEC148|nr:hypothetical protein [Mesorhizobium sp. M8A.F.Ca.ET.057.01.1.1]
MKVPEIYPSAPIISLLEKVVYHPVHGARLSRRNFHPKAVSLDELGGLIAVRSGRSELQHSGVLLAGHASTARYIDVAKLFKTVSGDRLLAWIHG